MSILLTGFEPFGTHAINSSQRVVEALTGARIGGVSIQTAILPVSDELGPGALIRAVQQHQPRAVLCLGQAARRPAISIERIAINLKSYEMPDNDGRAMVDAPVVVGGPAAYFATLPVRLMRDALRREGIPAELSQDAGAYLCNQVLYALLHHVAGNGPATHCGFIHLPLLPEQAAGEPQAAASMDLATMCCAVTVALEAVAAASGVQSSNT